MSRLPEQRTHRAIFIQHLHQGRYHIAALLILVFAAMLRILLTAYGWPASNSDEGTMGLEALHIAHRGEHPIFLYGQHYMGVAEAYIGSVLFSLSSASVFTLRLGMILLYTLFLLSLYLLTRLLYSKGLALFVLLLLSIGSTNFLILELVAGGGLLETLLCGTLLLLLSSWLAYTSFATRQDAPQRNWKRLAAYAAWGCAAGLGLWSHLLIVPYVLTSAAMLVLFCRQELKQAWLYLLAAFLLGAFPLLYYNITNPLDNSLVVFIEITHAADTHAPTGLLLYAQQAIATFFYALPISTGYSQICPYQQLPLYGPFTSSTLSCSLAQGAWSVGYVALFALAVALAFKPLRKLWRLYGPRVHSWPAADGPQAALHVAQLMLLASAAMTILLYALSPLAAAKPWSTRYLAALLVTMPAVIWPLWQGLRDRPAASIKKVLSRLCCVAALLLIAATYVIGTAQVFSAIPAAQAATQQDQRLISYLLQHNMRHMYGGYWTCDNLMFESHEQIVCGVLTARDKQLIVGLNRYPPYYSIVYADSQSAYVFPEHSDLQAAFESTMQNSSTAFEQLHFDGYVIFRPRTYSGS